VVCASAHEAAWLERNLLQARRPPWNRSQGEEVPVHVRLDARPRSPGIRVVHRVEPAPTGVEFFGPYLGSVRTGQAVAGLQRVLPVAYTAQGLSGGQVDLGRMLGVDGFDRAEVVRTLRGVLERDVDAVAWVRQQLARRRDAAARALAFERAGQVQAELEALAWLVADQRVTTAEPVSHDVSGWAEGLLVQFAVRDGRMSSWTRRRCSFESARPHLDATAPQWREFARDNAELAATLARGSGQDVGRAVDQGFDRAVDQGFDWAVDQGFDRAVDQAAPSDRPVTTRKRARSRSSARELGPTSSSNSPGSTTRRPSAATSVQATAGTSSETRVC
jgi:excinuclease ABC subunit C